MDSATKRAMLEAFTNVPTDDPVVKWTTVPQVLHKWLDRYLLSAGRPEGGIWKWDYIRARDHF